MFYVLLSGGLQPMAGAWGLGLGGGGLLVFFFTLECRPSPTAPSSSLVQDTRFSS